MPESDDPPTPLPSGMPTNLGGVSADELLARGLHTVKMSSAGAHGWTPPTVEEVAQLFPNYEVLGMLGRGGMGAVFKARQISLDRIVAIKLLPLEISVDQNFVDRFRREARAMAKLNHPNIISVHDFGQTAEGHLFFVMEFVEGANLSEIIHQVGLDPEQALALTGQVCTALAYAHGKGVVHRDIKPANVMVDHESHVKVADFGLARLTDPTAETYGTTMTGMVMGTPDYMAPEQKRGMNVDQRADIYSVGVMLYEMLCRKVPHGVFALPSQVTGCDARIDQIVLRAMQQEVELRYQSTQEMRADVDGARTPLIGPADTGRISQQVSEISPVRREDTLPAPPARRSRIGAVLAISAVVVVAVLAFVFLRPGKPKNTADSHLESPPSSAEGSQDGRFESVGVQTPPVSDASSVRANPVQTFGGHRYQFINGNVTWHEAKAKAESMGGHLATLTTKEESDWAMATFRHHLSPGRGSGKAWIGALKNSEEEPWRWVTGEPFGFADWFAKLADPESERPNAQGPFAGGLNVAGRWSVSKASLKSVAGFLVEWDNHDHYLHGTPKV